MAVPTGLYFPLYFSCCSSPKVCSLRDTTYSRLERSQMQDWEITHYMSRSRETSAPLRIPFHRVTPDWMIPEESMKPQSLENIHPEGVKEKELHWASHFTLPKCGATSAQLIDRSPEAREAQWSWDRDTLANALRILSWISSPAGLLQIDSCKEWDFIFCSQMSLDFTSWYCVANTSPPNWHFMI